MLTNDFWEKTSRFIQGSIAITWRYFKAKFVISLLMSVIAAVVFAILKLPLWGLLGLIAGMSNFVPIFGAWIGAIVCCLIVVIALQVLDQFLLSPLIMGQAMRLKPLLVILIVLVASACLGFWGLLLGIPIAACIKLAYDIYFIKNETGGYPRG